ncbi:MAG: heme biosynthesis protein [Desulfobacteraceae bacterium 4572_19]|nr:MAG: heme biosynthesis protein [Desulfobacteraceae bacterium 4572_19]
MIKKTVAFSRESTNLFFHILTRCNLSCNHCYINCDQHGKTDLPFETIKKWLALFVENHSETNVIFLGGEPTLHKDLSEAVKYARFLGYKSITIDTNGYLFHNILDNITPEDLDFMSFSLDGATCETNDLIRGKGCYEKCVSGIKKAVLKGFKTSLIYTVSSSNFHELTMMPELLKDLGINRFFIQVIGLRGNLSEENLSDLNFANNSSLQVSRKQWLNKIPEVALKTANLGITVTYPKVFLNLNDSFECAGKVADNYFIFPNGRVYKCPLCEDYPMHGMIIKNNKLISTEKINETDLFNLDIPEGCVMNKLIQPGNLSYKKDGSAEYKVACCLLKEEIKAY